MIKPVKESKIGVFALKIKKAGFFGIINKLSRVCLKFAKNLVWRIQDAMQFRSSKQPNILYAFYDLDVSTATFDFLMFLAVAELERKNEKCETIHVVVVPGRDQGFRKDDLNFYRKYGASDYGIDSMHWRLRNILSPCCWLIPSCQQLTVFNSRNEAKSFQMLFAKNVFPHGYTVSCPIAKHDPHYGKLGITDKKTLPCIKSRPQALSYVDDWIRSRSAGRKVISITLRESSYECNRNSNIKNWVEFVRSLDQTVYFPVIIRDTQVAFNELPKELYGLTVFWEASWNIEIRAAFYESSYLNMSVNNGTNLLCLLNPAVRYILINNITPEDEMLYLTRRGVKKGEQLAYTTSFQRLVWEEDSLEVIKSEFYKMCELIDKSIIRESNYMDK